MASIQKRPDGKWRCRYTDPTGRERSKHFPRKIDAQRFGNSVEEAKQRGAYVDPADATTVAAYARQWVEGRPYRPTSRRTVETQLRAIEAHPLGGQRLNAVRTSDVQAWATAQVAKGQAPVTVRRALGQLKSIFSSAIEDRLIERQPVRRISLPPAEQRPVTPLTVPQVRALADAMPPRHRAMVITQAGLGLRLGELLALRIADVDFLRRTVRVDWQITQTRPAVRSVPKTPRSRRTLPLPQTVADALAAHLAQWPSLPDGTIFYHEPWAGYPARHYDPRSYAYAFGVAVAAATAADPEAFPAGTTSHALRHHYASVLIHAGESVLVVAERLGHANAGLVLSTYGHLLPNTEDRTRNAVDAAWAADPAADSAVDSTAGGGVRKRGNGGKRRTVRAIDGS